jgi:hypothetical protein
MLLAQLPLRSRARAFSATVAPSSYLPWSQSSRACRLRVAMSSAPCAAVPAGAPAASIATISTFVAIRPSHECTMLPPKGDSECSDCACMVCPNGVGTSEHRNTRMWGSYAKLAAARGAMASSCAPAFRYLGANLAIAEYFPPRNSLACAHSARVICVSSSTTSAHSEESDTPSRRTPFRIGNWAASNSSLIDASVERSEIGAKRDRLRVIT